MINFIYFAFCPWKTVLAPSLGATGHGENSLVLLTLYMKLHTRVKCEALSSLAWARDSVYSCVEAMASGMSSRSLGRREHGRASGPACRRKSLWPQSRRIRAGTKGKTGPSRSWGRLMEAGHWEWSCGLGERAQVCQSGTEESSWSLAGDKVGKIGWHLACQWGVWLLSYRQMEKDKGFRPWGVWGMRVVGLPIAGWFEQAT